MDSDFDARWSKGSRGECYTHGMLTGSYLSFGLPKNEPFEIIINGAYAKLIKNTFKDANGRSVPDILVRGLITGKETLIEVKTKKSHKNKISLNAKDVKDYLGVASEYDDFFILFFCIDDNDRTLYKITKEVLRKPIDVFTSGEKVFLYDKEDCIALVPIPASLILNDPDDLS